MQNKNPDHLEKLIESVKEIVEITRDKTEQMELSVHLINRQTANIKDQQSVMNKKLNGLEERSEKLEKTVDDQLLPSTLEIEKVLTGYGDMYKLNDDNIRKLEKRIKKTETKLEIEPSPEHILAEVQ